MQVVEQLDQELHWYRSQKQEKPAEKQPRSSSSRNKLLDGAIRRIQTGFSHSHALQQILKPLILQLLVWLDI